MNHVAKLASLSVGGKIDRILLQPLCYNTESDDLSHGSKLYKGYMYATCFFNVIVQIIIMLLLQCQMFLTRAFVCVHTNTCTSETICSSDPTFIYCIVLFLLFRTVLVLCCSGGGGGGGTKCAKEILHPCLTYD